MIIQKIFAEEIFNAQAVPTAKCTIELENGHVITSSIPSGFQTPDPAVPYHYDKDNRIIHQRMQQSIDYINNTIVPLLIKQPINALAMDSILMDLHASSHDTHIGSNTTLVVSMALFKAQAAAEGIQLFQLLQSMSGTEKVNVPKPITSLFEFRHHDTLQDIKELLVLSSTDQESFEQELHNLILIHHHTKKILELKKQPTTTTKYGSFTVKTNSIDELFDLIQEITNTLPTSSYNFGLNIDADAFWDAGTKIYHWQHQALTSVNLINEYQKLLKNHPNIVYLQDSIASADTAGWQELTATLPTSIHNAAEIIFGTNPMKIRWGVLKKISNTVVIKPEYISSISQTLAAIDACKNNSKNFIIAGDMLGTSDAFISDLAVGTGAKLLKAGAPSGSEHMTKYNRLLEIERTLQNL